MRLFAKALLFIIFLAPVLVFSQKINVKFGPEKIFEGKKVYYLGSNLLTEDDIFFYNSTTGKNKSSLYVEKVKKGNGETVWTKELSSYVYSAGTRFIQLMKTDDGFISFVKKEDSKLKQSILVAQKLDDELSPVGAEKVVATSNNRDKGSEKFLFKVNQYKNKFLVEGYFLSIKEHNLKEEPYYFSAVDHNLNMLWQKAFDLPQGKFYSPEGSALDTNGNIRALFKISTNGKKLTDASATFDYIAFTYNYGKDVTRSKVIEYAGKISHVMTVRQDIPDDDNTVLIYGAYSNRSEKEDGIEGIFSIKLDCEQMAITKFEVVPFTKEIIEKLIGEKKAAKGKLPSDLVILNKVDFKEGKSSLVLEERTQSSSGEGRFYERLYYCGKVLIITINKEGKVEWFNIISKNQSASGMRYLSVEAFSEYNRLIILYNEEAVFRVMTFDESGNTSSEGFTPGPEKRMSFYIHGIKKDKEGRYLIPCERLNSSVLYEIEASMNAFLTIEE